MLTLSLLWLNAMQSMPGQARARRPGPLAGGEHAGVCPGGRSQVKKCPWATNCLHTAARLWFLFLRPGSILVEGGLVVVAFCPYDRTISPDWMRSPRARACLPFLLLIG